MTYPRCQTFDHGTCLMAHTQKDCSSIWDARGHLHNVWHNRQGVRNGTMVIPAQCATWSMDQSYGCKSSGVSTCCQLSILLLKAVDAENRYWKLSTVLFQAGDSWNLFRLLKAARSDFRLAGCEQWNWSISMSKGTSEQWNDGVFGICQGQATSDGA